MLPKKGGYKLQRRHFVIAGLVGLISGILLQGPQFPLKTEATFSLQNFFTYGLAATSGVLFFMRLNLPRE
ncbi:hypothetical protein [Adhaeribacter rhizoryzae]|uniref:Uncharacterized protein n=1 Tax=Adhaeribacter rhizoryzae TaxID=2607907 RepID=A0A5M6DNV5_9BACT|nr:hypothetical protein [Adhaeribacter rhizoryzae]KAA5549221.1 hypothetical protein F0145_01105 [Adhaeribacter rhizoryzae]